MEYPESDMKVRRFNDYKIRLGDEMRGLRASMGKSLLDVEQDLRIRASLIHAIEKADANSFDTKWVIPGYVRTYAKYLGMDPEDGYQRFCKETGYTQKLGTSLTLNAKKTASKKKISTQRLGLNRFFAIKFSNSEKKSVQKLFADKREFRKLSSTLLICGLVLGIGYVGWTVYDAIGSVRNTGLTQQSATEVDLVELSSLVSTNETATESISDKAPTIFSSTANAKPMGEILPGEYGLYAVGNQNVDAAIVSNFIEEAIKVDLEQVNKETARQAAEDALPKIDPNLVMIVPSRAAWVRITKPDGTVIKEGTLVAGSNYQVPNDIGQLLLRAGNSGSVYFVVGGGVYGPAGKGTSVAKNVALSASELQSKYARVINDKIPEEVTSIVLNLQTRNSAR